MPCDTVQTSVVDLGKVLPDMLDKAVNALGIAGRLSSGATLWGLFEGRPVGLRRQGASLVVSGRINADSVLSAVKRSYTGELVKARAAAYGWRVQVGAAGKLVLSR